MTRSLAWDDLNPSITAALDEILGDPGVDPELREKLRTVIVNCLAANFSDSDVRAVIETAAALIREAENGA